MNGQRILTSGLVLVLALSLAVGLSRAEGPVSPYQGEGQVGVELAPLGTAASAPLSTGFTYQGQLKQGGNPVNGTCDFQFGLWNAASGGTQIGTTQTKTNVSVSNGLFTIPDLDFGGGAFTGDARWLAIAARCPAGGGSYSTLDPRQALTPAPYALALPGLWTQQNATSPNLIGGYNGNSVTAGVVGATIGGGGASGSTNLVTDNYGTVGGGAENRAGNANGDPADGGYATVGGGSENIASSYAATVGGGYDNTASGYAATVGGGHLITVTGGYATAGGGLSNTASGLYALVAGGGDNTASGQAATVGGGYGNVASGVNATVGGGEHTSVTGQAATVAGGSYITATSDYAAIGGGQHHTASAPYATIGGGEFNTASGYDATVGGGNWNEGSGEGATVGGGDSNIADGGRATVGGGSVNTASGWAATVPGGYGNTAQGNNSFAAGNRAKAYHNGAFVWADSWTNTDFESQQAHQFRVRAWGGAQFNDGLGDWVELLWTLPIATSTGAWLSWDGIWWNASDVALKENFAPVDSREVLQKLANMPITTWNYRGKDVDTRHLGPTGQDFYAAFGLGDSDRAISTLDADGVALTAIQGLYELVQEKDGQIAVLEAEVSTLHQQNTDLEARVAALEQAVGASPSSPANPPGGWWPLFLGGLVVAAGVMIQRRHPGGGR